MSETETLTTPLEIDTHIADLSLALTKSEHNLVAAEARILNAAGARQNYQGRDLVWSMTLTEAKAKLLTETNLDDYRGDHAKEVLSQYVVAGGRVSVDRAALKEAKALYTGWSRFFVVTSSNGHIHSSTHCSTCYPTTAFGWLPHLSGKDETDAVEACGEALCSVCFPSAPVSQTSGSISQEDAKRMAQGATRAELQAERDAAKQAKADAKAEKARKAAVRAEKLLAKVEAAYEAHGGFQAVLAMESVYDLTCSLPSTVGDVIRDDHREAHGERRFNKNPREVIAASEAAPVTTEVCPGSGSTASREQPHRTGYAYGNSATCPCCSQMVATTTRHGMKVRKHTREVMA